ncbi:MAG: TolC family protein [Marinifilaceae bacterium]|jgi:outer membrane protein TolC|nr:TolC family protein [Marinifilaceae bacterium]
MIKNILLIIITVFSVGSLRAQNELSIAQAIELGLQNNYKIKIEKTNLSISEINNSWGAAGAFPELSLSMGKSLTGKSGDTQIEATNNNSASVQLNGITIFNGFAVRVQKSKLDELQNLSQGKYSLLVENTVELIMLSYYKALVENEKLEASRFIMKLSEDRYKRDQKKYDSGNSTSYQLLQSKIAFLDDKTSYMQNQVNYKNAIRDLNYTIGEKEDKLYKLSSNLNVDFPELILGNLLDNLNSNNSNLKNQYINLKINELEIRKAKSSFMPNLSANAAYNYNMDKTKMEATGWSDYAKTNGFNLGLNLKYSIFSGGSRKRALDIARINKEASEVSLEDMKHNLRNELYKEFENYNLQNEMLALSNEQLSAAKLNLDLSAKKFRLGVINSFNYRDIQEIFLSSSLAYSNAKFAYIQSRIGLLKMTGAIVQNEDKKD